jgi:hypothetical protein
VGFLKRPPGSSTPGTGDPDVAAIEQMRRDGANPALRHETRHFIYVPGAKAAQTLARSLQAADREVEVDTSARRGYWLVVVRQPMIVSPEAIRALRRELEAAARAVGGDYDRWQVDVAST